jgi:hypothetical protein
VLRAELLADQFFLMAHGDRDGRARLAPRVLGLGLAAAHRLARVGLLRTVTRRRLLGSRPHWVPTDMTAAASPGVRITARVIRGEPLTVADAFLAGLAQATQLDPVVLWGLSARETQYLDHRIQCLPEPLAELAADRVGAPSVMAFVLSGVAVATVVAGVATTMFAVTGLVAIPAAFVVVAAVLAVFAVGYVAMARHVRNSGVFFAYVTAGLGRAVGVAAAFDAVVAYQLLQVGLYGAFGPAAATFLGDHLGWHQPWWVWSLIAWVAVASLVQTGFALTVILAFVVGGWDPMVKLFFGAARPAARASCSCSC